MVNFDRWRCSTCPLKKRCTRSTARTLSFLQQELFNIQAQARAEQQSAAWRADYRRRAGVESTICELVNGHGMRQTRYTTQNKAHVQHVLTAIAVNIERIHAHLNADQPPPSRPSTALQQILDRWQVPRTSASWRSIR